MKICAKMRKKKEESLDKEIIDQTHKSSLKTIVKIDTKSRVRKEFESRVLKFKQKISSDQSTNVMYQN